MTPGPAVEVTGPTTVFDPALEYVALAIGTVVICPLGLWAHRRADRRIRRLGTINQY